MISEQQVLFPNEGLLREGSPAKTSRSRGNVPVLPDNAPDFIGRLYDSWMSYRQSTSSSKTSLVFCHQTEDGTWESSSGRLLTGGTASHGVCLTLNTSESPSVAVECLLSDVLETTGPHLAKYSALSEGLRGHLEASKPTRKDTATDAGESAPVLLTMREGKPGGGKGPLISTDQSLTLATGNGQVLIEPAVARMRGFGDYEIDGTMSAVKARDYKDATDLVVGQDHTLGEAL